MDTIQPSLESLVQKDRSERLVACQAEVQQVLDKYKCRFEVAMLLTKDGIQPRIDIYPNEVS